MTSFAIDVPQALIERLKKGDARAYEQLYRLFERPVYTLAWRMLGDADEAREILHDAMLVLIDKLDTFRGESPFWGWLRQIAVNETLMRLRKRRIDYYDELPEPDASAQPPQAFPLEAADLERALGELSPLTRSIVDVVVSNCVLNLVPNKQQVFSEVFRVLKEGGHFSISDVVLSGTLPAKIQGAAELYVGCVSGAMQEHEYLGIIHGMGFEQEVEPLYAQIRAACPSTADGVLIAGTGFRCVAILEALEQDLGRPVISANQASLWHGLRSAGVRSGIAGYGNLFSL